MILRVDAIKIVETVLEEQLEIVAFHFPKMEDEGKLVCSRCMPPWNHPCRTYITARHVVELLQTLLKGLRE